MLDKHYEIPRLYNWFYVPARIDRNEFFRFLSPIFIRAECVVDSILNRYHRSRAITGVM